MQKNAEECAVRFINCHYRFHRFPNAITSDRDSNWVGDFWKRFCEIAKMERRLSTAFHPKTDGSTERMNQEIIAYLHKIISFAQLDWPNLLPTAQLAKNYRNNSASGLSPFSLEHGYHIGPKVQDQDSRGVSRSNPTKRAECFVRRLCDTQEYTAATMASTQQEMEIQANRSRNPSPQFRIWDKVWLNLGNINTPQPKKKFSWVNAKCTVTRIISPHIIELDVPLRIHQRFHVQLLKRACEDPLPSQIRDDAQPPPVFPETEAAVNSEVEPEQFVEKILRAEKVRRGRGWIRRVLVKWQNFAESTWEDRSVVVDTFCSRYI